MKSLMEYTGGNIVFKIGFAILELIVVVSLVIKFLVDMKKEQGINKSKKIEYVIMIILLVILSISMGRTVGYCEGILKVL